MEVEVQSEPLMDVAPPDLMPHAPPDGSWISREDHDAQVDRLVCHMAEMHARAVNMEVLLGMRNQSFGDLKFIGPFSPGAFDRVLERKKRELLGIEEVQGGEPETITATGRRV